MKYLLRLIPGLLVLSLAACAPRILVEHDNNAKLTGLHSFAWVTPPAGPVRNPIIDSQILEERVQRAVIATLKTRGYVETSPQNHPDFLVTYHTSTKLVQDTNSSFSFGIVDTFPYSMAGVMVPVGGTTAHEEGTLMLDVIDGNSKRLVWRGWTTGWVTQQNYSEQAVNQAVQQILARFPSS